ncbi:glycosyltransferase, MtfB-like family [Citrifermentans bemidjiense Bem]|uniref:Glycosyltransferase, MtfB-like family n=1 Tax=Citrifermentans bemidjiense (strain ATCC BAA-1014 / DSM 16622 / JCM 12645 / Bem) TaxID=404380 RepID=B5E8Q3_CITBB|nr:glycosyltransferase family 1 protein [Citrifermentans bemidjiense]ACH38638.1 glycosyltransferase, MtfB-like family [Citrifermentans bemidjiense Bem]
MIVVGVDASNIRAGGGITHLGQLLAAADLEALGVRVLVWGGAYTLGCLPDRSRLEKLHVQLLDRTLPVRMAWQRWMLPRCLAQHSCDVLFSPGGTLPTAPGLPCVVMSQNLLPFEPAEARRFGASFMRVKMLLLRASQKRSFEQAQGTIFLTRYAHDTVRAQLDRAPGKVAIIPHGIEERFFGGLKCRGESFSPSRPLRLLYVSIVDVYKHQWHVAEAVAALRLKGVPLWVEFVGPCYRPAGKRLADAIRRLDPAGEFLKYTGPLSFERLEEKYQKADAFVFASSCENLPNILLEAMATGLPIACSGSGPMPEVLGEGGVYFNPERPEEIAQAIMRLYQDGALRTRLALQARQAARSFSWERCARETFSFIAQVACGNGR